MDATTPAGAPLISFESGDDRCSLCVVWRHVSSEKRAITSYVLYLNHRKCGDDVKPDRDSDRCKVIVGACQEDMPYHVVIGAIAQSKHEGCLFICTQTYVHFIGKLLNADVSLQTKLLRKCRTSSASSFLAITTLMTHPTATPTTTTRHCHLRNRSSASTEATSLRVPPEPSRTCRTWSTAPRSQIKVSPVVLLILLPSTKFRFCFEIFSKHCILLRLSSTRCDWLV